MANYEQGGDEKFCTECGSPTSKRTLINGISYNCLTEHGRFLSTGKNYCPHCGKKLRNAEKKGNFCTKCGANHGDEHSRKKDNTPKSCSATHERLRSIGYKYCPSCGEAT